MTSARLEAKLGFDKVRAIISDKCKTDYAAERVAQEEFSTSRTTIRKRLQITEEMRLVLLFEENFPTTGYIDGLPFLNPLQHEGANDIAQVRHQCRETLPHDLPPDMRDPAPPAQ